MSSFQRVFLCVFCSFFPPSMVAQSVIHVPADKMTIQAAMDAAANGDTVLVAPGTYNERIDFKGKNVVVTSSDGAIKTIIDGQNSGSVVTFSNGETAAAVLSGFTIQHGSADPGPGIDIGGAGPTIEHNIIQDNNCGMGGGIYAGASSATIRYNTIRHNNRAANCPAGLGGGVTISGGGTVKLLYNLIEDNLGGYHGGGIALWAAGTAVVEGNIVRDNSSTWSSGGGGLIIEADAGSIVRYNTFVNNYGGGVAWYGPPGAFIGNTVAGNDGGTGTNTASAIVGFTFGTDFRNNLLVAKAGQNALYCEPGTVDATQFSQNDVFSNGGVAYSGCEDLTGVQGNVSVDPLFANEGVGNFHLSAGSPVIDTADGTVPYIPSGDVDGNARVVDGGSGTAKLDLGAYEYNGLTTLVLSSAGLIFSPQRVGTTSAAQTIVVQNSGTQTLHLKPTQIGANFRQTNTCELPDGLPVNATCTYSVIFQPSAPGDKTESLILAGGNISGISTVTLTGTGTAPIVSVSTTSVSFNDQTVYVTSVPQDILVTNIGDASLTVSEVGITGEFAKTNNCGRLAPNSSCKITVTFTPMGAGARSGLVTITDDATGSPRQIALTGNGVSGDVQYPTPVLTNLNVNAVAKESPTSILIQGIGLFPTSVAYLDGQALTTMNATPTTLLVSIDASLLTSSGEHEMTVVNPPTGGGTSNALPLTVYQSLPLSVKALLFDRYRRVFYVSVPGAAGSNPNTIVTIDPNTAAIVGTPVAIGNDPGALAISDDGHFLYVGLSNSIKRVDLYTGQVDLEIALGADSFFGAYGVSNIAVVPGAPHSIVASLEFANVSPYSAGVKVFDDDVARPASLGPDAYIDSVVFSDDSTILYAATGGVTPATLYELKLDASGLTQISSHWDSVGSPISTDGTLVYSGNKVVDPATYAQAGTFSFLTTWAWSVYPEPDVNRVFLAEASYLNVSRVWAADRTSFSSKGELTLTTSWDLSRLQRWGSDGLAWVSEDYTPTNADEIMFIRSSTVRPGSGGGAAFITCLLPAVKSEGSLNFEMKVLGAGFQPGAVVKWNDDERTTVFVNSSEVRALIPASDVAQAGQATVTVVNAGGTDSNAMTFIAGHSMELSATALNFGTSPVASTSSTLSVTVTNNTNTDYTVSGVLASGDFKVTNSCLGKLAVGGTCTLQVVFRPMLSGFLTGTLLISSDAPGSPLGVQLSGTGTIEAIIPIRPVRHGRNQSSGASSAVSAQAKSTNAGVSSSQASGTVQSSGQIEWLTVSQLFSYWTAEPSQDEQKRSSSDDSNDAVPIADKKKPLREAE